MTWITETVHIQYLDVIPVLQPSIKNSLIKPDSNDWTITQVLNCKIKS